MAGDVVLLPRDMEVAPSLVSRIEADGSLSVPEGFADFAVYGPRVAIPDGWYRVSVEVTPPKAPFFVDAFDRGHVLAQLEQGASRVLCFRSTGVEELEIRVKAMGQPFAIRAVRIEQVLGPGRIDRIRDAAFGTSRARHEAANPLDDVWRRLNEGPRRDWPVAPPGQEIAKWAARRPITVVSTDASAEVVRASLVALDVDLPALSLTAEDSFAFERFLADAADDAATKQALYDAEAASPSLDLSQTFMRMLATHPSAYLHTALARHSVTIVCPFTGLTVRSTHGFPVAVDEAKQVHILYRFSSSETYYLCAGNYTANKFFIYLPRLETVIMLRDLDTAWGGVEEIVIALRQLMVANSEAVAAYLDAPTSPAILLDSLNNLGHSLWNDVSGLFHAAKTRSLVTITKALRYRYSFIPADLVAGIDLESTRAETPEALFQEALRRQLLLVRPVAMAMTQELAADIRSKARHLCSAETMAQVEKASEADLLVWVNLRAHNKIWSNQVEGIIRLVGHLRSMVARLAIFFDGTSDCAGIMAEIVSGLPPDVATYDGLHLSIADSITVASAVHFYIATIGSGLTLVTWVAEKPGIAHSETSHLDQMEFWQAVQPGSPAPLIPNREDIVEEGSGMYCNYRIDPAVMERLVDKLLERLPISMRSIERKAVDSNG